MTEIPRTQTPNHGHRVTVNGVNVTEAAAAASRCHDNDDAVHPVCLLCRESFSLLVFEMPTQADIADDLRVY